MNQRVVFFVALVCIAQLGVTLTRNFWSEQSRKVQHSSLARVLPAVNATTGSPTSLQRGSSPALTSHPSIKKGKATAEKPVAPTPATVSNPPHDESVGKTTLNASIDVKEQAHPVTKALLPPPHSLETTPAKITTISQPVVQDPFVPFFSIRKDSSNDSTRSLTEYELDQLKVTAIISDSHGEHFASVETPSGRGFIVKPGSMIGARGGRITTILPSKVVIVEPAKTANGSVGSIERELSLKTSSDSRAIIRTNYLSGN